MTTSSRYTRRDSIKLGTALAAAAVGPALLGSRGLRAAEITTADVAPPAFPIENGARLTVLRPSKFVDGDERLFLANTKKFEEQYGIPVKVEQEGWEDLRPKVAWPPTSAAAPMSRSPGRRTRICSPARRCA